MCAGEDRSPDKPDKRNSSTADGFNPRPVAPRIAESALSLAEELPWRRHRVPDGYWTIRENRLLFVYWLGLQCAFAKATDWYGLRRHHFQRNGGGGLLRNAYCSSVLRAMQDYQPDYDWKPRLFGGVPNGFWQCRDNRAKYMDWVAEQLDVRRPEGWYAVTAGDIFGAYGGGLLNNHFGSSIQALLVDYMPEYDWKPWLFSSVPQSYWRSVNHRIAFMEWLGRRLKFRRPSDWQRLKREHFINNGGSGLFVAYYRGSIARAVQEYLEEEK